MIAMIVRFKSALSDAEVLRVYESRADRYRATKGLRQKYYLRYHDTGEHGAVYIWDSAADLEAFRGSELRRSIASTYQVRGEPEVQTAEVVMVVD